jgi:hypothetical protein
MRCRSGNYSELRMPFTKRYCFHVLAPSSGRTAALVNLSAAIQGTNYARMLRGAQKLRGDCYLADGAITAFDIDQDGCFPMESDALAWHLLLLDTFENVVGCVRFLVHTPGAGFEELNIQHASVFRSQLGPALREIIEADMELAWFNGLVYAEVGGWAIADGWRKTKAVLDMIAGAYALGEIWGGSLGICTATARHSSATILKKFGASPISVGGAPLNPYVDPKYQCEMELLRFDRVPAQRFGPLIDPMKHELGSLVSVYATARRPSQNSVPMPQLVGVA